MKLFAALKHTGANAHVQIYRPAAARTQPQTQEETTTQTAKTTTAGPLLMHAALTPAQRRYLCTIAASYGPTRVRHLITQHYINVLHRWKCTGHSSDRDEVTVMAVTPHESESGKGQSLSQSEVPSRAKHKERKNTNSQPPGKSFLPNIPDREKRFSRTLASKPRKMKMHKTTSPKIKRSPRRFKNRLLKEEEDEEEEGKGNSLSQYLSSLSVGEQDQCSFSDSFIL
ncbi:Protein FAM216A [Channa argus]|uniref:Protein FAM216A n=1 Tax=Channa argus TaxID=215402 RepID=A0A6G1QF72_CHAAH|nr:Protein FAM216A [Channa argus]